MEMLKIKIIMFYLLFVFVVYFWALACWGTNSQGSNCLTYSVEEFFVVGKIHIFNWFDEQSIVPCRFTLKTIVIFYTYFVWMFCLYKYVQAKINGGSEGIKTDLIEFCGAILCYLFLLGREVWLVGIKVDLSLVFAALGGIFLVTFPALVIIFLRRYFIKQFKIDGFVKGTVVLLLTYLCFIMFFWVGVHFY